MPKTDRIVFINENSVVVDLIVVVVFRVVVRVVDVVVVDVVEEVVVVVDVLNKGELSIPAAMEADDPVSD